MTGACLSENALYYAKISCDDDKYKPNLYKGIYSTTFNKRCASQKKIFFIRKKRKTIQNYVLNTGS